MKRSIIWVFLVTAAVVPLMLVIGCRSLDRDRRISDSLNQDNPQTWVEISFTVRRKDYRLCLPADLSQFAPVWSTRGGGDPRLLPGKAVSLSRGALGRHFDDAALWTLDSVELRELPEVDPLSGLPVSTGRWYYEIGFRPPDQGIRTRGPNQSPADTYRFFVLLNGTVIEPKLKVEQGAARNSRRAGQLSGL